MTEKWIVDDAGTLINMENRENYDYMEEVVDVLNKLSEENEQLKQQMTKYDEICEKICNWDFDEIVKVLDAQKETEKENEWLKETIKELELENAKHIGDGEWDIRDITYGHGKFRLEEWGERYHQFYNGDKQLEDEEVVSLLFENEQLKKENKELQQEIDDTWKKYEDAHGMSIRNTEWY